MPSPLLLVFFLLGGVFASVPTHPESAKHEEHKLVKCYECYEANATVTGVCTKTSFCEGHWCVKGPDSGGVFHGCMDRLPFQEQTAKCVIVKGPFTCLSLRLWPRFRTGRRGQRELLLQHGLLQRGPLLDAPLGGAPPAPSAPLVFALIRRSPRYQTT
uniref:Secreted protein n=1 Tax=Steinernema glaseri TaxID=37863 RepID=A0A1I7YPE4_9BILA